MGWKFSDLALFSRRAEELKPGPQLDKECSLEPPSRFQTPGYQSPEEEAISTCWEILTKGGDHSSSGPLPESSDPTIQTLEDFFSKGAYTVKIKKGIKKKDLFRFLLAKMLYEQEDGLHLDEYLVLWELYLHLLEVPLKDPSFQEKYGEFFKNSLHFFQILGDQMEFPIRLEENENSRYLDRIAQALEPMLPSRAAYFGLKGQKDLRSGFSLVFPGELLRRKLPEVRRIGVGYRDKGSRRDPAFDGSPDWREVARSHSESRILEVENFLGLVREHPEFDWDLVYNTKPLFDETREEEELPLPED